jgi:hypothetical protein
VEPAVCKDWPYIPLLLSWTIPAIYKRVAWGNLIVKDPKKELENLRPIILNEIDEESKNHKHFAVTLTTLASMYFLG